ncbi:uncharacterized protein LOC115451461 isoform X1 [Manduca sexta]|uniref:uncharacterized protein LOC115451461 isoform X1 n=2 Tax=Manduca sexta TaxID=7130 RepID=UPI00188F2734|nr:uncharacterized protein LOC115451461 isoform X1 [Manduca sexta]
MENYKIAWELLCERFDNNRLLINDHIQALYQAECIQKESSSCLRHLIDLTNKNIRALTSLKATNNWDLFIIYMMSTKLDITTSKLWEEHQNTLSHMPTLSEFCSFLNGRATVLETIGNKHVKAKSEPTKQKSFIIASNNNDNSHHQKHVPKCPLCKHDHFLFSCETFRKLTIECRIEKAKEHKVCLNCLKPGHMSKQCSLSHCKYCKFKHNTLLHLNKPNALAATDPMPTTANNVALSTNAMHVSAPHILLSTAMVRVADSKGDKHDARLLLDNGSTANFITDGLCTKLGLSRSSSDCTVTGINNQISNSTQSCNLILESRYGDYRVDLHCLILPEITKTLPSTFINIKQIALPSGIQLADQLFYKPAAIDILVGAEIFWNVLGSSSIDLGKNQPKLYETKLGWIVSGYVARPISSTTFKCNFSYTELSHDLTKFWEIDSVSTKHSLSTEERLCEQSFNSNTYRDDDGCFVVTMPLKNDPKVLGDSYEMAKYRFLSLERRFQRDPVFKNMYMEFMQEYERLGHMTENHKSNPSEKVGINYYLPHHGVLRESSTTTKLRTVFDASAVTTTGVSLNDIQMVGPVIQNDLHSILTRFRQHKFVIAADIEKMYRAINIIPSQQSLQQIIFRYDKSQPLKTYTLNTVTYGTASAPYLATKCLVSLASAVCDDQFSSQVKRSIECDFYVDDLLSGGSTLTETIELSKRIINVLASAKFKLHKWKSNSHEILKEIANLKITTQVQPESIVDLSNNSNMSNKTLGLNWLAHQDMLSYSIGIENHEKITKRHILSIISQIFDPLGLVGPCIVQSKMVMQKLWVDGNKCDWDDEVLDEVKNLWLSFVDTLPYLNQLRIPRWVLIDDYISVELHTFTDASERAYGACVYVRSLKQDQTVKTQLLISKNKVAPLKPTTIPRLELCGALLGARLCKKVTQSLTLPITKCRFWSDSTIVLGWLSMPTNKLKPFVRNRCHEIQESTIGNLWSYVPSKDNPADLVSRGLSANLIKDCELWWSGPSFLANDESGWPSMPSKCKDSKLPDIVSHFSSTTAENSEWHSLLLKHSNFIKLQKIVAYIFRFIRNCRNKTDKLSGPITVTELHKSLTFILHNAQLEMFPEEYHILYSKKPLPAKNRLLSLSPFLDPEGLIRVGEA